MELKNISQIEKATAFGRLELLKFGFALMFIVGIMLFAGMQLQDVGGGYMLIAAAMIGGYMAMNIGANDVANNVGPAVGSKALTLNGPPAGCHNGMGLQHLPGPQGPEKAMED